MSHGPAPQRGSQILITDSWALLSVPAFATGSSGETSPFHPMGLVLLVEGDLWPQGIPWFQPQWD